MSLFGGFLVKLTGGYAVIFHYFKFKVAHNLCLWLDCNKLSAIVLF